MTKNTLLSNTTFNVLAKISASLVSFIVGAYAARRLGVAEFGEAQYVVWFVTIVWIYANLGLPTTVIRYVALYSSRSNEISRAILKRVLTVGVAPMIVGLIVIVFFLRGDWLLLGEALLFLVLTAIQSVLQSLHEGRYDYSRIFKASVVGAGVSLCTFYLLIDQFGIHGYLGNFILNSLAFSLVAFLSGRDNWATWSRSVEIDWKNISQFAFYTWIAAIISSFIWQRVELFFIKKYLTLSDVAYFSVAMNLTALITQPIALMSSTLLPFFARTNENEAEHARYVYSFLTKLFAWCTFYLCFVVAAHSTIFLTTVYGRDYRPASTLMGVILAGSAFGIIATIGSALVYGLGKSRFIAIFGTVGAFMAIASGFFIIPVYGVLSAGISKIAIQIVMVGIGTVYIVRHLQYAFPFRSYCTSLIISAATVAVWKFLIPAETLSGFLVNFTVATITYLGATWFLRVFDEKDLSMLRSASSRIFSALRWKVS
jgi:O-antigen/teichoic acid export membrane protein